MCTLHLFLAAKHISFVIEAQRISTVKYTHIRVNIYLYTCTLRHCANTSHNEHQVAQRAAPKTKSHFTPPNATPTPSNSSSSSSSEQIHVAATASANAAAALAAIDLVPPGSQFLHREDWGEKYEGISTLGLFIVDLNAGRVVEVRWCSGVSLIHCSTVFRGCI
jgi:hypothetical protein